MELKKFLKDFEEGKIKLSHKEVKVFEEEYRDFYEQIRRYIFNEEENEYIVSYRREMEYLFFLSEKFSYSLNGKLEFIFLIPFKGEYYFQEELYSYEIMLEKRKVEFRLKKLKGELKEKKNKIIFNYGNFAFLDEHKDKFSIYFRGKNCNLFITKTDEVIKDLTNNFYLRRVFIVKNQNKEEELIIFTEDFKEKKIFKDFMMTPPKREKEVKDRYYIVEDNKNTIIYNKYGFKMELGNIPQKSIRQEEVKNLYSDEKEKIKVFKINKKIERKNLYSYIDESNTISFSCNTFIFTTGKNVLEISPLPGVYEIFIRDSKFDLNKDSVKSRITNIKNIFYTDIQEIRTSDINYSVQNNIFFSEDTVIKSRKRISYIADEEINENQIFPRELKNVNTLEYLKKFYKIKELLEEEVELNKIRIKQKIIGSGDIISGLNIEPKFINNQIFFFTYDEEHLKFLKSIISKSLDTLEIDECILYLRKYYFKLYNLYLIFSIFSYYELLKGIEENLNDLNSQEDLKYFLKKINDSIMFLEENYIIPFDNKEKLFELKEYLENVENNKLNIIKNFKYRIKEKIKIDIQELLKEYNNFVRKNNERFKKIQKYIYEQVKIGNTNKDIQNIIDKIIQDILSNDLFLDKIILENLKNRLEKGEISLQECKSFLMNEINEYSIYFLKEIDIDENIDNIVNTIDNKNLKNCYSKKQCNDILKIIKIILYELRNIFIQDNKQEKITLLSKI